MGYNYTISEISPYTHGTKYLLVKTEEVQTEHVDEISHRVSKHFLFYREITLIHISPVQRLCFETFVYK